MPRAKSRTKKKTLKLYAKPGYRRKALLFYAALLRDPNMPVLRVGQSCYIFDVPTVASYINVPLESFSDILRYLRRLNLLEATFPSAMSGNHTAFIVLAPIIDNGMTLIPVDKQAEKEKINALLTKIKPQSIKHLFHWIIAIYTNVLLKNEKFPEGTKITQKLRHELTRLEKLFENVDKSNACPWAIYCAIGFRRKG